MENYKDLMFGCDINVFQEHSLDIFTERGLDESEDILHTATFIIDPIILHNDIFESVLESMKNLLNII